MLRRGIDRAQIDAVTEMSPEQRGEAMVVAIQGIVLLHDRDSLPRLRELGRGDSNLRVRDAALRAVEELAK